MIRVFVECVGDHSPSVHVASKRHKETRGATSRPKLHGAAQRLRIKKGSKW